MTTQLKRGKQPYSHNTKHRGSVQPQTAVHVEPRLAIRTANLSLILRVSKADPAHLSSTAEISLPRLMRILANEEPLSDELVTHVEEMLSTGSGWFDIRQLEDSIPEKTLKILAGTEIPDIEKQVETAMTQATAIENTPKTTVSGREIVPPALKQQRINNLLLITSAKGAKSALCRLLGQPDPYISFLRSEKKIFSREICARMEEKLGAPAYWMDHPQTMETVPESVWQILGNPVTSGTAVIPANAKHAAASSGTPAAKVKQTVVAAEPRKAAVSQGGGLQLGLLRPAPVAAEMAVMPESKPRVAPSVASAASVAKPAHASTTTARPLAPAPAVSEVQMSVSATSSSTTPSVMSSAPELTMPLVDAICNVLKHKAAAGQLSVENVYKMLGMSLGM